MLQWVRTLNTTYGQMFNAAYFVSADSPEPSVDLRWVQDMVVRTVKPLFFEAMKRFIMNENGDYNKLKLLLADLRVYVTLSPDPMRWMSDEVEQLLHIERANAETINPPEMTHIERIPWMANEMYGVTHASKGEIKSAVKRKHWEVYDEIWPPAETQSGEASTAAAPPEASAEVTAGGAH